MIFGHTKNPTKAALKDARRSLDKLRTTHDIAVEHARDAVEDANDTHQMHEISSVDAVQVEDLLAMDQAQSQLEVVQVDAEQLEPIHEAQKRVLELEEELRAEEPVETDIEPAITDESTANRPDR